jgi:hypothetical protein
MAKQQTTRERKLKSLLCKLRGEFKHVMSSEPYDEGDLLIVMTLIAREIYRVTSGTYSLSEELSPEEVLAILEKSNE